MTAVLAPTDALRNGMFSTHEENSIDFSSTSVDWRAKYMEVADVLADTRNELEDFQQSSKELEEELERDIERAEKSQRDLQVKVAKAERERDDWKGKFMSLQTTHNTTTTSLQRELDMLRQEVQKTKVQLRDLEMGNDDLERNERLIASSLADIESKYSRALEEKILLEHELLDKAGLEEECQRMRDELRDANEEIGILKEQASTAGSRLSMLSQPSSSSSNRSSSSIKRPTGRLDKRSSDLKLSDLSPSKTSFAPMHSPMHSPKKSSVDVSARGSLSKSTATARPGLQASQAASTSKPAITSPVFSRSQTTPALGRLQRNSGPSATGGTSPTRVPRTPSGGTTSMGVPSTGIPRSKGVQMVSEMRARVKNLEQRIHTRVPRLRMGSVSALKGPAMLNAPTTSTPPPGTPPIYRAHALTTRTVSLDVDRPTARLARPPDSEHKRNSSVADSSGWVLIMEDSPSPVKDKAKLRASRRSISPTARPLLQSASARSGLTRSAISATTNIGGSAGRTTSRLSASTATSTSIGTPVSRPTTPTFLPVPSGMKTRQAAPSAFSQVKRSSLGAPANAPAVLSPTGIRPPSRGPFSASYRGSAGGDGLAIDDLSGPLPSAGLGRSSSTKASSADLTKSRIGRPGAPPRRTSAGGHADALGEAAKDFVRSRVGSSAGRLR